MTSQFTNTQGEWQLPECHSSPEEEDDGADFDPDEATLHCSSNRNCTPPERDDDFPGLGVLTQGTASAVAGLFSLNRSSSAMVANSNPPQATENPLPELRPIIPPAGVATIARSVADCLRDHSNSSLALNQQEKDLSAKNLRGKNSNKHENTKRNLVSCFFDTIKDFGGKDLEPLLTIAPLESKDNRVVGFQFHDLVGGEKTIDKKVIIDKCLMLCGFKWRQKTGKNKGLMLAPRTFGDYMKQIFCVFESHGIRHNYKEDFNSKGEYHGIMIKQWEMERRKDPTCGTRKNQAKFDWNGDAKIQTHLDAGTFDPFHNPQHLIDALVCIHGRFFCLRGVKELTELMILDACGGVYDGSMGELHGIECEAIEVPVSKTRQVNLSNPTAPTKEERCIEVATNPHDKLDPVKVI